MNGNAVVAAARAWIGTPYKHQASLRGIGADCIGLVRGVWRECIGTEPEVVPAYTPNWFQCDGISLDAAMRCHFNAVELTDVRPGDVLLFRMRMDAPIKHCAIVSAPTKIIHAYWGRGVTETHLVPWWQRRIAAGFSFPEF